MGLNHVFKYLIMVGLAAPCVGSNGDFFQVQEDIKNNLHSTDLKVKNNDGLPITKKKCENVCCAVTVEEGEKRHNKLKHSPSIKGLVPYFENLLVSKIDTLKHVSFDVWVDVDIIFPIEPEPFELKSFPVEGYTEHAEEAEIKERAKILVAELELDALDEWKQIIHDAMVNCYQGILKLIIVHVKENPFIQAALSHPGILIKLKKLDTEFPGIYWHLTNISSNY